LQRPSEAQLKQILALKLQPLGMALDQLFTVDELDDMLNQASIRSVINRAAAYYRYKVNAIPLPPVYESVHHNGSPSAQRRLQQLEDDMTILKRQFAQLVRSLQQQEFSTGSLDQFFPAPEIASSESQLKFPSAPKFTQSSLNATQDRVLRYLEEKQKILEQDYSRPKIIDDHDDIGKLIEIAEALHRIRSFQIRVLRLGKRKIPEHVVLQNSQRGNVLGFLQIDGSSFTRYIQNFNELVINNQDLNLTLMRDSRQSKITGKVGQAEIAKLNHAPNGAFKILEKPDRVELELLYTLITDIHNRDLEVGLDEALEVLLNHRARHWLTEKLLLVDS
jgi:hypothetical protein